MAKCVLPLPEGARKVETKRRPANKVPSYHLTGDKTMKYIKEADERAKEKELKDKKTEYIKKEAVKQKHELLKGQQRKQKNSYPLESSYPLDFSHVM